MPMPGVAGARRHCVFTPPPKHADTTRLFQTPISNFTRCAVWRSAVAAAQLKRLVKKRHLKIARMWVLVLLLAVAFSAAHAQDTSSIKTALESKEFVFKAETALPTSG